jgi:hypothetical protein
MQGVAHLVEHVTFLGSKRRESLLGTGARANAYTDFHHTVFHVHAPLTNCITGTPMLPQVRRIGIRGNVFIWVPLKFRVGTHQYKTPIKQLQNCNAKAASPSACTLA